MSKCPSIRRLCNIAVCVYVCVFMCVYVYVHIYIYHILFIHSSLEDTCIDCFYFFAIVNNAAINIGVQKSVQVSALISFGYIPKWNC